jgi:hypothetical protein
MILDPRGLAPRIANLDIYAWHVIDALREKSRRHPEERLDAIVAEIEQVVPSGAARTRTTSATPYHFGSVPPTASSPC